MPALRKKEKSTLQFSVVTSSPTGYQASPMLFKLYIYMLIHHKENAYIDLVHQKNLQKKGLEQVDLNRL